MSIEQAFKTSMDELLSANHIFWKNTMTTKTWMNDGKHTTSVAALINAVTQRHRGQYDQYDAGLFLIIKNLIEGEHILWYRVPLGYEPGGDNEFEKNNDKLKNLPPEFVGYFQGGYGDDDGYLRLTEQIKVDDKIISPRQYPLEVGFTRPHSTYFNLLQCQGLARWPYDFDEIQVFHLPNFVWPFRPPEFE